MLRETIRLLDLRDGLLVADGTIGAGGHSQEILRQIAPGGRLIGLDRDPMMLELAAARLGESADRFLRQASYAELPRILQELELKAVDRVLLDLGLSSDQLADETRGFSFNADGPLDLRFDTSKGVSAAQLLASKSADEIREILEKYGEERNAGAIAKQLTSRAVQLPSLTGRELGELVASVDGATVRRRGSHPATRVFQALRIAVNDELDQLHEMLQGVLPKCLRPGGRVVLITFHSLEDRMVKNAFRNRDVWRDVAKPMKPTPSEVRVNPRSRSAQVRTATRV